MSEVQESRSWHCSKGLKERELRFGGKEFNHEKVILNSPQVVN